VVPGSILIESPGSLLIIANSHQFLDDPQYLADNRSNLSESLLIMLKN
jgi:hypothetical protein